jgi:hypothetical protein
MVIACSLRNLQSEVPDKAMPLSKDAQQYAEKRYAQRLRSTNEEHEKRLAFLAGGLIKRKDKVSRSNY